MSALDFVLVADAIDAGLLHLVSRLHGKLIRGVAQHLVLHVHRTVLLHQVLVFLGTEGLIVLVLLVVLLDLFLHVLIVVAFPRVVPGLDAATDTKNVVIGDLALVDEVVQVALCAEILRVW